MYEQVFKLHAKLLKALAHPRRLEVLHLLKEGPATVEEMQDMLGLPQANLSQHLKILRDAGAVSYHRLGKRLRYHLAHPNFAKASQLIRDIIVVQQGDKKPDEFSRTMKDLMPIVHDPVCHMRVSPSTAGAAMQYQGKKYYFCASGCKKAFQKNPGKYAK
ncbi:MAG: metalloregulator ArsR/SmtB family transcription factor [Candidatus Nomurabacteria bacterium]|nr:MAG: metalloregulator ArsR/SmtB family transcription factor [Candidatus Nomurabacteria bacterium]